MQAKALKISSFYWVATYRGVLIGVHTHPERKKVPTVKWTERFDREDKTNCKQSDVQPYGILMKDSMGMVPPPQIQTVKKTIRRVVENIIWRA